MCERERKRERERECVCVCVRESVCVREREREGERESVCVCVCVRERDRVSVCWSVCEGIKIDSAAEHVCFTVCVVNLFACGQMSEWMNVCVRVHIHIHSTHIFIEADKLATTQKVASKHVLHGTHSYAHLHIGIRTYMHACYKSPRPHAKTHTHIHTHINIYKLTLTQF